MLRLLFLHTPTKLNRCINVFKLSFTEDASIHIMISYHIEIPSYDDTRIWKVLRKFYGPTYVLHMYAESHALLFE